MILSTHFTLDEATASSTATRLGIDNMPTDTQLANMRVAADGMERVRLALGGNPINVDSWLRVESLERTLTAKDYAAWCGRHGHRIDDQSWAMYFAHKAHPKGYAVDFTCPAFGTPAEIVKKLRESGIRFDQCIMEGSWVHVSFDPQMRGQFLIATFINGTPTYAEA